MTKRVEKKQKKEVTVQVRLTDTQLTDLDLIKQNYGFLTDAAATRFLIVRTADNIRNGHPLAIIPQMQG